MNQIVEVKFKKDRQKSPVPTYSTFKSQDVDTVEFHLEFNGFVLDENYTVEVFCKFKLSDTSLLEAAEISDGKAIFKFDSRYITRTEQVYCSVYARQNDKSIDVRTFVFDVELSEIDKGNKHVAEVYDENYREQLEDFKRRVDEQIQSAQDQFALESAIMYNSYTQAEQLRDEKSKEAVEDFEHIADDSLDTKLGEIQIQANQALDATVDAFNLIADEAVSDKLQEFDGITGQILDDIQQAEAERVEAEKLREIRLAQLEAQLEIISKIILRQTIAMGASWDKSSNSRMTRMDVM